MIYLVLTHLPNHADAVRLARLLVEQKLAACVNIGSPVQSLYRWRGMIETATEIPLAIKTTQALYPKVEALIKENHPYELPEIVALELTAGLAHYLQWIVEETDHA